MLKVIINGRTLRNIGSVIDVCPTGDYSEFLPQGRRADRLAGHWEVAGDYLRKALDQYDIGKVEQARSGERQSA